MLDLASEDRRRPPACPGLSCQEQERQEQAQSLAPAFLVVSRVVFSLAFQVLEPQVLSMRPRSWVKIMNLQQRTSWIAGGQGFLQPQVKMNVELDTSEMTKASLPVHPA